MAKLEQIYNQSKIIVDAHKNKGHAFICSAYTPGAPDSIEPEYLTITVTHAELMAHVAGSNRKVTVAHADNQDTEDVPFWLWHSDVERNQPSMLNPILTDIINEREGRIHDFPTDLQLDAAILMQIENDGFECVVSGYNFSIYEKECVELAINDAGITVKNDSIITGHLHTSMCNKDSVLLFLLSTRVINFPSSIKVNRNEHLQNIADGSGSDIQCIGGGNVGIFFPRAIQAVA